MRKALSILLAFLLALSSVTGAAAEKDKPLSALCDSAFELLFGTSNVTLEGEANFSLDENWFKTAKAKYIQDGDRSYWDLKLSSPKTDGTIRENGYTIIADGSKIYVMEVFQPGIYKTGTGAPQSTILRDSVQMELMKQVVRFLAAQAETESEPISILIDENEAEKSIRIKLSGSTPDWFNTSLNVLAEYAAKRYFHMDYDQIGTRNIVPMSYYLTVTEGILACTTSVALKQADVIIKTDLNGQIEHISGSTSIIVNTARDGERTLNITFDFNVSDRGKSQVGTFDPISYDVKLVEGGMNIEDVEYTEVDDFTGEKLIEQARGAWEQAGYTLDPSTFGYCYKQNGRYCIELNDTTENLFLSCITNKDGKLLELRNTQNNWQDKNFDYDNLYPDTQLAEEAGKKVMEFLKEANPVDMKRVDHLKLQCWYEEDNELYFEFCEDPLAQDWDGFLVVVKVKPDWQLMYYSCFSNG
jgi:hypothetical protein